MSKDFTRVGEILDGLTAVNAKFKYALKASTLFGFWGQIVGRKFDKFSKPLNLKFSKLTVLCQNSCVAQELGFFKKDLLKKISIYSKPLGLEINDIIFSVKWPLEENNSEAGDFTTSEFSDTELEAIQLNEDEILGIRKNIDKLDFLNERQKEKHLNDILNSLRAKKMRETLALRPEIV